MESWPMFETESATESGTHADESTRVHDWRAEQLRRLGFPYVHAEVFADIVDWHVLADLISRGCTPALALKIVR